MCGIAGILDSSGVPLAGVIRAMTGSMAHRGPNDEGFLLAEPDLWATADLLVGERRQPDLPQGIARVALGHRRLSIIDTSPAGHQPMCDATRRYWLVSNGEIYNYLELRRELELLGVSFRSDSDTEVLVEAWRQWGAACLLKFIGMFSFALYDTQARTLTIARDPFGIKPLYIARNATSLAFSSEPAALLEVPWVRRVPDAQRVYDYLRYGRTDDGSLTFFADVERFPAGHYAVIHVDRPQTMSPVRYWHDAPDVDESITLDQAASTLRELLLHSVELHLRSDVPFGAALSGGLDSSALVCLVREVLGPHRDLHTFSFLTDDPALSEERWIDTMVKRVGPVHHAVEPSGDELLADIDHLVKAQGEPILGLSSYAEFRVFGLAKQAGVTVVLDGQGADEMFAGYSPYLGQRLATLVRSGRVPQAYQFWRTASSSPHAKALGRSVGVHAARASLPAWVEPFGRRMMRDGPFLPWMRAPWFESRHIRQTAHRNPTHRWMLQAALADDREHMFQWQLRSEDRDAMWHSVENRVPFLTTPLVRFARSLPEHLLIDDQATPKAVLRAAMRGIVPDEVLDRKEKIGFAPPEHRWLKHIEPWIDESLVLLRERADALVDVDALQQSWSTSQGSSRLDAAVWRAVNLARWMEGHDLALEGTSLVTGAAR